MNTVLQLIVLVLGLIHPSTPISAADIEQHVRRGAAHAIEAGRALADGDASRGTTLWLSAVAEWSAAVPGDASNDRAGVASASDAE